MPLWDRIAAKCVSSCQVRDCCNFRFSPHPLSWHLQHNFTLPTSKKPTHPPTTTSRISCSHNRHPLSDDHASNTVLARYRLHRTGDICTLGHRLVNLDLLWQDERSIILPQPSTTGLSDPFLPAPCSSSSLHRISHGFTRVNAIIHHVASQRLQTFH